MSAVKTYPFMDEIISYEKQDRKKFPPRGATVFIGSSIIRGWTTLEKDMYPLKVINRGFGGSQAEHASYYAGRIVIPYDPGAVVFYEGSNDHANGKTPGMIVSDCRRFVKQVLSALPGTIIFFVSIQPCPARFAKWKSMQKTNRLIKKMTQENRDLEYIDISKKMLDSKGRPRAKLFLEDMLHLNNEGYKVWTRVIKDNLLKYKVKNLLKHRSRKK